MLQERYAVVLRFRLIVLLLAPMLAGCSNRAARVEQPDVDPDDVARCMIEEYDKNGDGTLSALELNACPAIALSLKAYDKNSDGAVSETEISERIAGIYKDRVAYYRLYAKVTLDGRPLRGATVKFIPEAAFADALREATGQTNQQGSAPIKVAEADMPSDLRGIFWGIQTGLYRIQVHHDAAALPDDVVSGERFGAEVTNAKSLSGVQVAIKSR